jgi:N-acetylglucosaminyldiphosphoundecaprenol N-acetyl-beta-D-mannosaminyltransferase
MRQTVAILGTPVDMLDMKQTLARLEEFIQDRCFHQVATANTDFLVNAVSDPELLHILRNADLVVADGMPLVWASRIMGSPLPERVTGADMVPQLASLAAQKGYRIYMLGGRPEVAQRAKAKMEADYPNIQIVGCVSPPLSSIIEMDGDALLADIERAAPDILLVAFGNPKQEKWIHMHRERLRNVPVCIGVGGTFDFIAGEVPRASSLVQRSGFEWVHRLAHNPRYLWKRYGRDLTQGGLHLFQQCRALKRQGQSGQFEMYTTQVGDYSIISLRGDVKSASLPRFRALAMRLLKQGSYLVLDLQGVVSLDAEALGALIDLQRQAVNCGRAVRLVSVPARIANALDRSQIQQEFLPIANSVAHALTERQHGGLNWRVHVGHEAAVVTVNGTSDHKSISHLEMICECILGDGKRLDMDVREITYSDSRLLSALYRLQCRRHGGKDNSFRLVASEPILRDLAKEKILDRFTLCNVPDVPHDAKEVSPFLLESQKVQPIARSEPEPGRNFAIVSVS